MTAPVMSFRPNMRTWPMKSFLPTTMPPMTSPWPLRYLVTECTTTSQPRSHSQSTVSPLISAQARMTSGSPASPPSRRMSLTKTSTLSSMPSSSCSSVLQPHTQPPESVHEQSVTSAAASTVITLAPRSAASTVAQAPAMPQPSTSTSASRSQVSGTSATHCGGTTSWAAASSA